MPYATKAMMLDEFGERPLIQLTDRVAADLIDDAVLDRAMLRADAECDSYIGVRYPVPLAEPSAAVTGAACDLAWYYLHSDIDADHPAAIGRANALSLLRDIAAGRASAVMGGAVAPAVDALPQIESGGRVFGRGDW